MCGPDRRVVARQAAIRRWIRVRFGASDFRVLGLPGAGIIDAGLAALAAGAESVESLLVSVAAPRLRREGVPLPQKVFADADVRLYRLLDPRKLMSLVADIPDSAYARYPSLSRAGVEKAVDDFLTGGT